MTKRLFGCVELFTARPGVPAVLSARANNLFMCEGAEALARLLSGLEAYRPSHMYLEFQNGTAPEVIVTAEEGRSYYAGLETSGPPSDWDYLRVPIRGVSELSSSDVALYAANVVRFVAQSSGTAGVSGVPFSAAAGSRIFSAALVVAPVPDDRTQDLVFARTVFAEAVEKPDPGEFLLAWPYTINADV